jgi:hypothetical protein
MQNSNGCRSHENGELLQKSKSLEGELALARQQLTFAQV